MRRVGLLLLLALGCEPVNVTFVDGGAPPPGSDLSALPGGPGDLGPAPPDLLPPPTPYVFVAGYSPQIARFRFDPQTGTLLTLGTVPASGSPSWLSVDPARRHLYAVDETNSKVQAFTIAPSTAQLTPLGLIQPSGGSGPAFLSVDKSGAWVLVANYGSGTVATLKLQADGSLTTPGTPLSPGMMAHEIVTDATNQFAYVPCLGSGYIAQYAFSAATGALVPLSPATVPAPAGAGPRHLVFSPSGAFAYVINETASTISVYAVTGGKLGSQAIQTLSSRPPGQAGSNTGAELQMYPTGAWLYASNRGDDTIGLFDVGTDGKLTGVAWQKTGGQTPRSFTLDPSGQWLLVADQGSNDVRVFRIAAADGKLTAVGSPVTVPSPSVVAVVPLP